MKRLVIAQARLHHFRTAFYEQLRAELFSHDIELILIYGQPKRDEVEKKDSDDLAWASKIQNHYLRIGRIELLWQPYFKFLRRGDVVVVQQENRMLMNYILLLFRKIMGIKVAFWGHGINCQAVKPQGLRERWKRLLIKSPDWWFAYTEFTKNILNEAGVSKKNVTVVNNAIDTRTIRHWKTKIHLEDIEAKRAELNIRSDNIGVFCGSLYHLKRMAFLIDCAQQIRSEISGFELIIIGDGEDRRLVESAASRYSWIHYVGPKRGQDQVLHLMLGKVFLIPSGVGLAIVDSMIIGLPMITTRAPGHGPEIAYLRHGENGIITDDDKKLYSDAVVKLLSNDKELRDMSTKCLLMSDDISIDKMVSNFVTGTLLLLGES